jgi:hypothetical protein
MTPPREIIELAERFDRNRDAYRSPSYNETQLRREFLDPFFTALGWDVDNRAGWAEAYKEVIHEDAIKIGGFTKAPDYCFRVGGNRKFFVEAKKPAVDIRQDTSPAFQLRRYAWSAKLPLSVLTDFEEFSVYDCRIKPSAADKASAGRVRYFTYAEYSEKWEELASVFSKDAVLKGSFDKYAETTRSKRGTAEVDAAFLQEIETWRDLLARNLAIRNPRLSQRELNFAVQRTIDRIIFLRICEDRGIEPEGREKGRMKGSRWYGYIYLKNMNRQAIQKICVPRLVNRLLSSYDVEGTHFLDNVDVGGITLADKYRKQGLPYLLGLLNSKLLGWYFPFISAPFRGGWRSANRQFLSQLPVRTIDFSDPADKARHDRMVALVESMLSLHKQLAAANTDHEKTALQRQIDATDRQIDHLVYELYGLTDEEIAIVEAATGPRK